MPSRFKIEGVRDGQIVKKIEEWAREKLRVSDGSYEESNRRCQLYRRSERDPWPECVGRCPGGGRCKLRLEIFRVGGRFTIRGSCC
jgi:hypothetical protein